MEMTLNEIATLIGAELVDCADPDVKIFMIMPIEAAGPGTVSFITNEKYLGHLENSEAAALICHPSMKDKPHKAALLLHDAPYVGFAKLMQAWFKVDTTWDGVHASAVVDSTARIAEQVSIGANCTIGRKAKIGNRVKLHPGVVIGPGASVGDDTVIYPNVTIYDGCTIGKKVIIHAGVVIGSDGFGFAPNLKEGRHEKIPQMGTVVVEDEVEIGSNTVIDRAVFGQTRIGAGTKIDNLVQIAHNVTVGKGCFLVSQVGIAGSSKIGNFVTLAGQVGVVGHITIGDHAQIGAQSGVSSDVKPNARLLGSPALEGGKSRRIYATQRNLPEMRKTLRQLERRVAELEKQEG